MADDTKKEEKKKDAKGEAPAAPAAGGKSGMIGIIAAAVVLIGVGAGVGLYIKKSLTPAAVEKPAPPGEDAHGDAHGDADPHAAADPHGGLLATGLEIENINLKANITGSGGTRYVTLTVGIWVPKTDQPKVNDPPVRRLIQAKLEETLRTYQLEDLQGPNIQARMKKDFGAAIERKLREIMPGRAIEQKFVLEVSIVDLITQ